MPAPSGLTCAIGPHSLFGKQRLNRHHPTLMRYFAEWVPEWRERYEEFRDEDVVGVCYRHHEAAHLKMKPILKKFWAGEPGREAALSATSACSASFWKWVTYQRSALL